ncbi:MAG: glycosyltransferase [Reichenbachiella sp.]|uniref:glycosyltransferase n=1 Tax=Reichenbachiella sp. TaxID=2184521 RepID=UPI003265A08A
MIEYLSIIVVVCWMILLIDLLIRRPHTQSSGHNEEWPRVSILISIRDEENHMVALCEKLKLLSYPLEKLEILFGDDASTDRTVEILKANQPKNSKIFLFAEHETGLFGKQKVLSSLSKKASGEFLLLTDADMSFGSDWIQAMLSRVSSEDQIIVGFTKVSGLKLLDRMQNLDWLFNETVVSHFANLGIPLTAWGNNMMVKKALFQKIDTGGLMENSIIEDLELMNKVIEKGGKLVINDSPAAVGVTHPEKSPVDLLQQRKRWLAGVKKINRIFILGAIIKLMLWPAIIYLGCINPLWIIVLPLLIVLRRLSLQRTLKMVNSNTSLVDLLLFEVYDFVFYLITFAFHLLPIKTVWKGRRY